MSHRFYILSLSLLALCLAIIALIASPIAPTFAQSTTLRGTLPATNTKRAPIQTPTVESGVTVIVVTATPTLTTRTVNIPARLCSDCLRVRLRRTPGTAGEVVDFLSDTSELIILGRSDDAIWLQVEVNLLGKSNVVGWVAAEFVRLTDDQALDVETINNLPVLDIAIAASPTPTSSVGVPNWLHQVSATSRQIFLKGQQLGNRANVFSRVGDSMTVSPYFLTPFGNGGYDLGAYGQLSGTISYFSQAQARSGNPFNNPSIAAGGGWTSHTLLLKGFAAKEICGDDTPLVCEYKLVKPAVALIMIGTNDSGSGSTDQFMGNLRQIVQTSIDMGVIPVLSTIPPKRIDEDQTARVLAFNQVIRSVAAQYDVPLWDYFAVMDTLPDKGMSSDGLHASVPPAGQAAVFTPENLQYGLTIRNLQALQVLDVLRRLALY